MIAYVALGDSFTAGTGCPPGARWPDRVAQALRPAHPDLVYRNYAEKGATTAQMLGRQVSRANQLEPSIVTVFCGANDVLESVRPDVDGAASRLAEAIDRLRDATPGTKIVGATVPESWRFLALGPRTRRRLCEGLRELNQLIRALAGERGVHLLEAAGHPDLDDPDNFGADGLHPSIAGHRRAAEEFIRLIEGELGYDCGGQRS